MPSEVQGHGETVWWGRNKPDKWNHWIVTELHGRWPPSHLFLRKEVYAVWWWGRWRERHDADHPPVAVIIEHNLDSRLTRRGALPPQNVA